jgi:hypothetical protein
MYDPKVGLVAPVTRNWAFGGTSQIDGDQTEGLFCWDGSFASYMLSLDALDWSFSNLIQVSRHTRTRGGKDTRHERATWHINSPLLPLPPPPPTPLLLPPFPSYSSASATLSLLLLCFCHPFP